jgi:hypothetical protein
MASPPCYFARLHSIQWHNADGRDCTHDDFKMQSDASTAHAGRRTFVRCSPAVQHGIWNTAWQGLSYADSNKHGCRRASYSGEIFAEAACVQGNQNIFGADSLSEQYVCRRIRDMCAGKTTICPVPYVAPAPRTAEKQPSSGPRYTMPSIKQDKVCQCEDHVKTRKVSNTIRDPERPEYGWCPTCVRKFSRKKEAAVAKDSAELARPVRTSSAAPYDESSASRQRYDTAVQAILKKY